MFSLRNFIMKGIKGMVGKEPDYKVIEVAAGWLDKGVLAESDLAELDELLEPAQTAEEPSAAEDDISQETVVEDTQEVTADE